MFIRILPAILLFCIMHGDMLIGVGINQEQDIVLSIFDRLMPGSYCFLLEPALWYYSIKKAEKPQKRFDAINSKDCYEMTLLHYVVQNGSIQEMKLLIKKRADVNATDFYRRTPLHRAVLNGNIEKTKLLIKKRATIDAISPFNNTSLHYAAQKGHSNIAKLLIKAGANVDATNIHGLTPLHIAVQKDNPNIAILLIVSDANIDVQDSDGKTPRNIVDNKCGEPMQSMPSNFDKERLQMIKAILQNSELT